MKQKFKPDSVETKKVLNAGCTAFWCVALCFSQGSLSFQLKFLCSNLVFKMEQSYRIESRLPFLGWCWNGAAQQFYRFSGIYLETFAKYRLSFWIDPFKIQQSFFVPDGWSGFNGCKSINSFFFTCLKDSNRWVGQTSCVVVCVAKNQAGIEFHCWTLFLNRLLSYFKWFFGY